MFSDILFLTTFPIVPCFMYCQNDHLILYLLELSVYSIIVSAYIFKKHKVTTTD